MLAFRPYDTNNSALQSQLGLSPPTKKFNQSPQKMLIDADLVYKASNVEEDRSFKFDLQSVTINAPGSSGGSAPLYPQSDDMKKNSESWQTDLLSKINTFENTFAERKAALMQSLKDLPCQETRKQMVEAFLNDMDKSSLRVLQSQGYARAKVNDTEKTVLFLSPVKNLSSSPLKKKTSLPKTKSPSKENSPLKKMGSLKK